MRYIVVGKGVRKNAGLEWSGVGASKNECRGGSLDMALELMIVLAMHIHAGIHSRQGKRKGTGFLFILGSSCFLPLSSRLFLTVLLLVPSWLRERLQFVEFLLLLHVVLNSLVVCFFSWGACPK